MSNIAFDALLEKSFATKNKIRAVADEQGCPCTEPTAYQLEESTYTEKMKDHRMVHGGNRSNARNSTDNEQ